MLVEFVVENFRSIHTRTVFSMQTAPYLKRLKETNTLMTEPVNLLKSSLVFGPNGSGKTNLINAISTLRGIILNFSNSPMNKRVKLPFQPFKMVDSFDESFTFFEVTLLLNKTLYKYSLRFNENIIESEALVEVKSGDDVILFERKLNLEEDNFTYYLSDRVTDLKSKTRKTVPYLSILADFNDDIGSEIVNWFINSLVILDADFGISSFENIYEKLEDENIKEKLLLFLKVADFNIIDIELVKRKEKVPENFKSFIDNFNKMLSMDIEHEDFIEIKDILTVYNKYDFDKNIIGKTYIHADSYESRGTNKMIIISLILLEAIENGKTLFIDEFDNAFHIAISKFLLKIFNSKHYNKTSQFILNTHDLSLLEGELLRVDQVWFVEKDKMNSSEFYSLYDFNETSNKARSDMSFAKDYLNGKFGAFPIVNDSVLINNIFNSGK